MLTVYQHKTTTDTGYFPPSDCRGAIICYFSYWAYHVAKHPVKYYDGNSALLEDRRVRMLQLYLSSSHRVQVSLGQMVDQ